jgi:hypothetical protein
MNLACVIETQGTMLHDAVASVDQTQQADRKCLSGDHRKV